MKQFFFFRTSEQASWQIYESEQIRNDRFDRMPFYPHWVCPSCGLEWARLMPEEFKPGQHHSFFHKKCPSCGGGSLRLWGDFPLAYLPQPLVEAQLNLILTHGERYDLL